MVRDGGDVQLQVVARPVVERRGLLDDEMSDLGREERDQGHLCRPRSTRGPKARGWRLGRLSPP